MVSPDHGLETVDKGDPEAARSSVFERSDKFLW